jgi:foldase protein PrsA
LESVDYACLSLAVLLFIGATAHAADAAPDAALSADAGAAAVSGARFETADGSAAEDIPSNVAVNDPGRVVARVGNDTIRQEDLLDWVRANPKAYSTFGAQWGRIAVLHEVIKESLLNAAAEDAFADDPDAQDLSETALQLRYRRKFLTPSRTVTEQELRAFYEQNRARFGIPPMVRVRELFFPKPPVGDADPTRATAWSVYEQLQSGASIADFVKDHAVDYPSRQAGGDRGYLSVVERPQLGQLAETMAAGDISEPIELDSGFSIVQLLDRRSGVAAPFEAVRSAVERALIMEREGDLIADFLATQARDRGVEILLPEYADAWTGVTPEPSTNESKD